MFRSRAVKLPAKGSTPARRPDLKIDIGISKPHQLTTGLATPFGHCSRLQNPERVLVRLAAPSIRRVFPCAAGRVLHILRVTCSVFSQFSGGG